MAEGSFANGDDKIVVEEGVYALILIMQGDSVLCCSSFTKAEV